MKIKCEYCGNHISDTDEKCPFCGAPNDHLVTSADGIPKTIEELIAFCNSHNIDYEKMRFFLGQDYQQPKAFGIYKKENGNCVVYKNKDDGTRAIRYEGKDEAYAVNEIYQKMRSELSERKAKHPENIGKNKYSSSTGSTPPPKTRSVKRKILRPILITFLLIILVGFIEAILAEPNSGYYNYDGKTYYNSDSDWYVYDNGWIPAIISDELRNNSSDYWDGYSYDSSYGVEDFEDSPYYDSEGSDDDDTWSDDDDTWSDSSWDDDDWDYDYDSWDSSDTDWGSDW